MSTLRFDDSVVVITGGGHGMGRAHCLAFAERGASVAVVDLDEAAGRQVADEVIEHGGRAIAIAVDTDPASHGDAIGETLARLGRVDVVVNNAGIAHHGAFDDESADDLDRLLGVHIRAPFAMVRAAWEELSSRRGRVVNVVSNAALFGKAGMTSYAASKGALLAWSRSLALEAAPRGVLVNAVAPIAATRLTDGMLGDLHEQLAPARVTPLVIWLAHPECREYGQVVSTAGGALARVAEARVAQGVAISAEDAARVLASPFDIATASMPASAADEVGFVRDELAAI